MVIIKIAPWLYRLFIVFVLAVSLFPFKHYYFSIFGTLISYSDILLLMLLGILMLLSLKKHLESQTSERIVKFLYFIIIYGLISTFWATRINSYWFTFYQLFLTFVSITIPYIMAKITSDKHIIFHKMISNFAIVLTFVYAVYAVNGESQRLGGYLGGAALIGAVMIPTLAVHFHNLVQKKRIVISLIGFLVTLYTALLTESRVTLVMLVLFMVVTLLRKPTLKRIFIVATLSLIFAFFIFEHISTERYNELLVDRNRQIAFQTSMEWATHSTQALLFGNGYGAIWQWHAFQLEQLPYWQFPLNPTEHGLLLFHAHSVFNQLFAELGLVGTVPFFIFIYQLVKETWKSWRVKNELKTDLMVSVMCSLPALFSDLLIFRNWEATIVWLFFVFTAMNYPLKKEAS